MQRDEVLSVGKPAIGELLLKIQTYKSLADLENGSKMFNAYSIVDDKMLKIREIVMARKEPRKLLVQPCLALKEDKSVELKAFPATTAGMIESFVARFPAEDEELLTLYEADIAAGVAGLE